MTLRLILGDQLNHKHSWFSEVDENVFYFMAEMRQETDYVKHHIQKIVGFFLSMRNFSEQLQEDGHKVVYWTLDASDNEQDLEKNLNKLIEQYEVDRFEYLLPDEYRLDEQLINFCETCGLNSEAYDTEHFFTQRTL